MLPTFRQDLEIVAEDRGGVAPRYVVRDPRSDEVFTLEAEARFICTLLDGVATAEEVRTRYRERFGLALEPERLDALVAQLEQRGLVEGGAPPRRTLPEFLHGDALFPFYHWRLGTGDRLFRTLASRLEGAFTRSGLVVAGGVIALGASVLCRDLGTWSDAVALNASLLFLLLALATVLILMQAVEQAAHGVAATRYGCQVHEIRIDFAFYVVPIPIVDWTEALLLKQKAQRLWALFAGIWVQLLVWGLATIGWWLSAPGGTWNFICLAVSLGAMLTFVLRGINPFVESSGSLLLSTWLEVPRMRVRALEAFGDWLHGYAPRDPGTPRERRWLTVYGALCSLYVVGIYALAAHRVGAKVAIDGGGASAMLIVGAVLFQRPLGYYIEESRPVRWFHAQDAVRRRRLKRLAWLALAAVLGLMPYPYETGGPFVLLPLSRTEIPAQVEGQVARVLVSEGQVIDADQPLAVLDPWQYEIQIKATREQLTAREAELRMVKAGPRPEEIERARSTVAGAQAEIARALQQVKASEVRLGYSEARAQRYDALYRDDAISRQDYEDAARARDVEQENLGAARAQLEVSRQVLEAAEIDLRILEAGSREEQIEALEAEVAQLKTVLTGLEEQLKLTVVRTTVPGRVVTAYVDQKAGAYVRKGTLFAVVEEAGTIQAEVQVPEEDAAELRPDARVKVVTWAYPNQTFYGRVSFVAPIASAEKQALRWRAVRVLTEIPNEDGLLKPAMTGYAKIAASWRPLGQVLLWPPLRWVLVQVWYWLP